MTTVEITRQELYELVWGTPTRHLCKRFGLSDVGLAKTCKRFDIPRPSYGYWAKKAAGGSVKRTPLPRCDNQRLQKIVFSPNDANKEEDEGFFDSQIRDLYETECQADPIEIRDSLRSPHPLVARTRDALSAAKSGKWSRNDGLIYPEAQEGVHVLDIACSRATIPRALRIMNALLKAGEPLALLDWLGHRMESSEGKGRLTPHRENSSFDGSKTNQSLDQIAESGPAEL